MSVRANGRMAAGRRAQAPAKLDAGPVSRVAMLAGASVAALMALGGAGVARAACVPSLQTISGNTAGPIVSDGGAITVTGSGSILGGPDGVDALDCPITTLTNEAGGAISGAGGGGAGVSNANTITTLTNIGMIAGGGAVSGGGGAGVSNAGTIATLTNSGAISGGGTDGGSGGGAGVANAQAQRSDR